MGGIVNEDTSMNTPKKTVDALPWQVALWLFLAPILVASGVDTFKIPRLQSFFTEIVSWDPWAPANHYHGHSIQLVVAFLLFLSLWIGSKQWGYYFNFPRHNSDKAGFMSMTCGYINDRERTLDCIMPFWGGLMIISTWMSPASWLLLCSLYSLLVALRCFTTLRRVHYADVYADVYAEGQHRWKVWSTRPFPLYADESSEDIRTRLESSLNKVHCKTNLKVKNVLYGWFWSHSLYAGAAFFMWGACALLLCWKGPGWPASIATIVCCIIYVFMFLSFNRYSEKRGNKLADYHDRFEKNPTTLFLAAFFGRYPNNSGAPN